MPHPWIPRRLRDAILAWSFPRDDDAIAGHDADASRLLRALVAAWSIDPADRPPDDDDDDDDDDD